MPNAVMSCCRQHHPRFKAFCRKFDVHKKYISMADYGGESAKGTWLYSAHPWIADIDK